jgi:hypothetical protein
MVPAVPLRNDLGKYRTRARVAWLFSVHATCERQIRFAVVRKLFRRGTANGCREWQGKSVGQFTQIEGVGGSVVRWAKTDTPSSHTSR